MTAKEMFEKEGYENINDFKSGTITFRKPTDNGEFDRIIEFNVEDESVETYMIGKYLKQSSLKLTQQEISLIYYQATELGWM